MRPDVVGQPRHQFQLILERQRGEVGAGHELDRDPRLLPQRAELVEDLLGGSPQQAALDQGGLDVGGERWR